LATVGGASMAACAPTMYPARLVTYAVIGLLLSLTAPPTSKPRPLAALAAAGLRVRALTEHGRTRLALHLGSIAFGHPVTGRLLRFEVPPPPSLKAALASCHGVRALTAPAVVAHPVPEHPERVLRSPRLVLQTRAMRRPA